MKIDFVIPVFNEEHIFQENADRILDHLKKIGSNLNWKLVFVVNGSSKYFEEMVRRYSFKHENVNVYIIKEKGKGVAIKKYFKISNAEALLYMDMDLAVSLDNIKGLIDPIISGEADMCFGSRMLPQSSRNRSWGREMSSKLYVYISQIILGHDFSDLQCGFKIITKKAWNEIAEKIKDDFWFFDTELIYYAKKIILAY